MYLVGMMHTVLGSVSNFIYCDSINRWYEWCGVTNYFMTYSDDINNNNLSLVTFLTRDDVWHSVAGGGCEAGLVKVAPVKDTYRCRSCPQPAPPLTAPLLLADITDGRWLGTILHFSTVPSMLLDDAIFFNFSFFVKCLLSAELVWRCGWHLCQFGSVNLQLLKKDSTSYFMV